MPQGLQIWDSSGVSVLDTSDRIGLIISSVQTGVVDGSVTDSRLGVGTPFWFCLLDNYTLGNIPIIPIISLSVNTLSWSFPSYPNGQRMTCTLYYGVY